MPKHTAKFKFVKETTNTVKYDEVKTPGTPPIIGQQYVQKWLLPSPFPTEITITVEFDGE